MFDIERLEKELPPIITRAQAVQAMGGAYSKGGLANRDSKGTGIKRSLLGKKVVYTREDFLEWLQENVKSAD
jgi:hypothetical protein